MMIQRILALLLLAMSVSAIDKPSDWLKENTKDTPMLIAVKDGAMTDLITGKKATVNGATVEKDPEMGDVLALDDSGKGTVSITYQGEADVLKGKGVTLEAWIKSDQDLDGGFALFFGFGALSFKNNKLQCNWLNFPTLPIYVEPEMAKKRLNYYPTSLTFNGLLPLRKGEWNHVALVYDENSKIVRSWINGTIDRECELIRDGQQYVSLKKGGKLLAFRGLKNAKIAGLRMRAGVYAPGEPPAMKHYLNQLPWQNKMVLTLDKIDPKLSLPLEVTATLENVKQPYTQTLTSHETNHLSIPMPPIPAGTYSITIKVHSKGKDIYNATEKYCNNPVPENGKIKLNEDKSLSFEGKKIFPVVVYGVTREDLKMVADLGFSSAQPKAVQLPSYSIPLSNTPLIRQWLDEATKNNLFLHVVINGKDKKSLEYVDFYKKFPKMLYWYNASEPWRDWDKFYDNYNFLRASDGEHPILSVQCASMHMKNTAPSCDIVGCDPYPVPNVSLRAVAGLTRNAIGASFGFKPVWTILGCYKPKIPTLQELRCMTVLAITAGTNGLGIYAWDERSKRQPNAYHTTDHPEIVAMLKTFLADIRSLETVLVEPNLKHQVSDRTQQPAIHASLKKANGKTYLFLANDQRCEEKALLTLPDSKFTQAVPLKEFGFKGTLKFDNGKCDAALPPLTSGVFELK